MGVRGCVAADAGHSLVTLLSLSVSVKDRSLHKPSRQVTDLLSRAHTWVWVLERRVALLSRIRLFPDRLSRFYFGGGGPCTALSPGLRSGGLESKFVQGSGPLDRRVMGWSCLCLGYKRGMCFWGTQLGALIRESPAFRYDLSMTPHRSKNWKMKDGKRKSDCLPLA